MKRLHVYLFAIFSVMLVNGIIAGRSFAQAQQAVPGDSTLTVTGMVIDAQTSDPVASATIEVEDSQVTATTDSTGMFQLQGIGQGDHTLKVTADGYQNSEKQIDAGNETQQVIIKLEPQQ